MMTGDKDLAELRQKHYGLFVHLLWKEPDSNFLLSLLEGIEERVEAVARMSPLMAEGWHSIRSYLENNDPGEVDYEFAQLFLGPHKPAIFPYESYYLAGSVFQAPLTQVRSFMKTVGLEKIEEELKEPEDSLSFELEIMNWLINKQFKSKVKEEEERWLDFQAEFLKKHLLVWAPYCARDLESVSHANFYKGAGMLLRGFLEIELHNFRDRGPDKVLSIDIARKRYGKRRAWTGSVFDAEPPSDAKK